MRNRLLAAIAAASMILATGAASAQSVRVATFNASLNRGEAGGLLAAVGTPDDPQIRKIAETIQRIDPDVLLINEFDYDATGQALALFQENYLGVDQNGATGVAYPHVFLMPSNTGEPTGLDLDRDGATDGPGDAQGFGFFPGQFGMVLLSKLPIDTDSARTFQTFLWRDMPDALAPIDPDSGAPWYDAKAWDELRLSSKSHWDVPIFVGQRRLHILASHPTPPVFDGAEDRNGRRNHDEIRFWSDYINGADYMTDDAGNKGDLADGASFVVLGDLNADPADGDGIREVIQTLLADPLVHDPLPRSGGGAAAALAQGGSNEGQSGDPALDTADFNDEFSGNLRVDYVLPSADLQVTDSGVFWPGPDDELARLNDASDHSLVWVDLNLP